MANMKITDYTQVIDLGGNEFLLISQDGVYKKVTLDQIRNLATDITNTELADLVGKVASATDVKNILTSITTSLSENTQNISKLSNPNYIIGGDFQIWQRGTSFTGIVSQYIADRWLISSSGARNVSKTDNGMFMQATGTETTGTNCRLHHYLEIPSALKGKKVTLSFGVIPTIANRKIGVQIFENNTNGTSVATQEFTLESANVVNNKMISFIMPNVDILCIGFGLSSATGIVLPNTYMGLTAETIWSNLTFNYVKLELGDKATPFIPRLYGEELALCQRYYCADVSLGLLSIVSGTNTAYFEVPVNTVMRSIPTLVNPTNLQIFNINNDEQTGFTYSISSNRGGSISIVATKTSHGLTSGFVLLPSTSGFDSEIY